jgi:acyl-CoA thioester hydrolase
MRLRVRFAETDQMGIAHHSAFVVWFEAGRVEWLRDRGMSYRTLEEEGVSLAVSELRVHYRRAVRFDDVLHLDTRMTDLRSRGCAFSYVLASEETGVVAARGQSLHVATDRGGRAIRIPGAWYERLRRAADDEAA